VQLRLALSVISVSYMLSISEMIIILRLCLTIYVGDESGAWSPLMLMLRMLIVVALSLDYL